MKIAEFVLYLVLYLFFLFFLHYNPEQVFSQ